MTQASYQTDHLFLLMGGNPLPNAVAALTLLKPRGTPHIVHTQQTKTQAQNLMTLLEAEFDYRAAPLLDLGQSQAEASVIYEKVWHRARQLQGSIGMNYTGGTKPMSVHAYRALAAARSGATFSYLDSNTSKITVESDRAPSLQLTLDVSLTLAQSFQLHGLHWRASQPPLAIPILPEAAAHLAMAYQDWGLACSWRQWCKHYLHSLTKQNDYWKCEVELGQVDRISLAHLAEPLRDLLQTYLGADAHSLSLAIACKQGFDSLMQVCAWLDGLWLEHYTLAQVQAIASSYAIQDSRLGLHMVEPSVPEPRFDKFEFDVAFMQGYHLFALSCTTGVKRARCKQKLLEAAVRGRQLGGSEARVALVCGYHRPEELRRELEVIGRDRRVAVFGRYDWPRLGHKIAEWVEGNG